MKWIGRRESGNVEDRRGGGGKIAAGGGIGALLIAAVIYLLGGDPSSVLPSEPGVSGQEQEAPAGPRPDDDLARYMGVVLADTEDVWDSLFTAGGKTYSQPNLVLFSGRDQSGCGPADAGMGPFYCPADNKIYIDLSFVQELQTRFGAQKGDFPIAYVLAHEVGHHVQHLLGITQQTSRLRQQLSKTEYNKVSVQVELQADFFAGIWVHYNQKMKNVLEPGDIEEALSAAAAVGDDRIQQQTQGQIVPDLFTHGTAAQRMEWFNKGYTTGDLSQSIKVGN
ncbi:MAG: metalloprotease [Sphingobacteriales bacterium]|nr:MAG: metalloprotease [Sphingobacteriales bacterium]